MGWETVIPAAGVILTILYALKIAKEELRNNRFLQRRDIAFRLLHESAFESEWLAAGRALFLKIHYSPDFNWKVFSEQRFDNYEALKPDQKKFAHQVSLVLNHYELIAVAVFSDIADEKIIKDQMKGQIILNFNETKEYTLAARKFLDNGRIYSQLEKLVNKWEEHEK